MHSYSFEILQKVLSYNHRTGELVWKHRDQSMFAGKNPARACAAWNTKFAGRPAFTSKTRGGYLTSTIFEKRVMAHRVAWCIANQCDLPDDCQIDHINGVRDDNRIENLRSCSASENARNKEFQKSSLRGAVFHKGTGKWQASIRIHLGSFDTEAEAAKAYEEAASKLHGEFYLPNGKRANVRRVL